MSKTMDPVAEFLDRWNEIGSEESTSMEDRWQQLGELAVSAVNALRGDCQGLIDAVGIEHPDAYHVVAEAVDIYSEYPQAVADDKRLGALGLMPVLITHQCEPSALARRVGIEEWAPLLPTGEPVPLLTDFLLTWEEVIDPRAITQVHEVFRRVDAAKRVESLEAVLGNVAAGSRFDGLEERDTNPRSLRFVPYYIDDGHQRRHLLLFENQAERDAWQERPFLAAEGRTIPPIDRVEPIAPMSYRNALWYALRILATRMLRELFDTLPGAESEVSPDADGRRRLLIEPIGFQTASIATAFRLSIFDEHRAVTIGHSATFFGVNWRSQHKSWETVTKIIESVAIQRFGIGSLTAPLVQDAGPVFMDDAEPRILIILGPCAAFDPPEPERIAIESAADPNHKHAKYWDLESKLSEASAKAITNLVAAAIDIDQAAIKIFPSSVIRFNGWRPAFSVYWERASTADRTAATTNLGDETLRGVAATVGLLLGRNWVFIQMSGSEGFMVP